ncbi:MAG: polyprenyl diphosphate synthase [Steroidobacteraceae bacterium]
MQVPRHIAIVMDGNGRWAQGRGAERAAGHRSGLDPVRMVIEESLRCQVGALTLFAFSSENWSRPAAEVASIMNLFFDALEAELPALNSNGVRLRFIGERGTLVAPLRARMMEAEAQTAGNAALQLQVAISYGGRQDILAAARQLAAACERGELRSDELDESSFAQALALAGLPDPDLFIRTGGEQRISNFLLWNLAYSELYFTPVLWPDFGSADFAAALRDFAARERRFGHSSALPEGP